MSAQAVFTSALSAVATSMKGHGFRRKGSKLTRTGEEVVSLVELQRSRTSTAAHLTFVINFGVAVRSLLDGLDAEKLIWTELHWQLRVSEDGVEVWQPVRDNDDPGAVAALTLALLERQALPALEKKQRESDLVTLWKTGQSPGLTEPGRLLCLGRLLHRAGRHQEAVEVREELDRLPVRPFEARASAQLKALEGT